MARPRPSIVIVVSVLQIVFAVTGACCGPGFILSGAMDFIVTLPDQLPHPPQHISQGKVFAKIDERLPWFRPAMFWGSVVSVFISAMMIAGAIGMLRLRRWGWYLTLAWAVMSLAHGLAGFVVNDWYVGPAMGAAQAEVFAEVPPPEPGKPDLRPMLEQTLQGGRFAGRFVPLLFLSYPIIMLGVVCLPSMRRAFRPEPLRSGGQPDTPESQPRPDSTIADSHREALP